MNKETVKDVFGEVKRMCNSFDCTCYGCSLKSIDSVLCRVHDMPEEDIDIVANWIEEHPRKTRREEFFKRFPVSAKMPINELMDNNESFYSALCCYSLGLCKECVGIKCKDCWDKPYNKFGEE